MLHFVAEERPLSIQIYGSGPERLADAARMVEAMGADVCDINMGCPANKVLRVCRAALTAMFTRRRIVAAVRRRSRYP